MEDRKFVQPLLLIIVFLIAGAAFTGVVQETITPSYIQIDEQCFNDGLDNNLDGNVDFIEDGECHLFPYSNGGGEMGTLPGSFDNNLNYQPYYDLTVDYVRDFVDKQCGGNLAGCVGTNFQNEVQFYCFFSNNIMFQSFDNIFDKFFNVAHQNMPNDGSFTMYMNTCNAFPPSSAPSDLPLIEYQSSSPIAENPNGEGEEGGK